VARLLAWGSLAWMAAEGTVGLIAGIRAGSVSLTGWALGSVIEALASVIVIWRFTGSRALSPTSEQRARQAVAVSFFLLAPYLAAASIHDLLSGHRPQASMLGIAVTAASLVLVPLLGMAKQRLGKQLDSRPPPGRAGRTCCAPRKPPRFWLAWPPPPRSAGGGLTPCWPWCWRQWRSVRGASLARRGLLLTNGWPPGPASLAASALGGGRG
jgi:hypothetical protein